MSYVMQIPEEMRKRYLERRKRDIEELTVALEARNFEFFKSVGHQLRGNAITFGYEELSVLGERLEQVSAEANTQAAELCLIEYRNWLQKQGGK